MSLPRIPLMDSSASPSSNTETPAQKPPRQLSPEFVRSFSDPVYREQNRQTALVANSQYVKALNRRQIRFYKEYLADPARNGTQAALKAGYSEYGAPEMARLNLKHPQIRAEIEKADKLLYDRLEVTQERVAKELAAISFARMTDYLSDEPDKDGTYKVDLSKVDAVQSAAIEEYSVERYAGTTKTRIKLVDKLQGLTMLGRILGVNVDSKTPPSLAQTTQLTVNFIDQILAGSASLADLTPVVEGRVA